MSLIYFPGCKYTAHSPINNDKIQNYLKKRFDMHITGCCSTSMSGVSDEDIAVYICPTCGAFLQEHSPQIKSISVWEILDEDSDFSWPNYHGEVIAVQDCWRAYDNRALQNAVRSILSRMNIVTEEIEASYDKADYCGISLLKPYSPRYERFAPMRFIENAGDKFIPHTEEEQRVLMQKHCAQFKTDKVVCYCTGCLEGLSIGGVNGIHLMDLVMNLVQ